MLAGIASCGAVVAANRNSSASPHQARWRRGMLRADCSRHALCCEVVTSDVTADAEAGSTSAARVASSAPRELDLALKEGLDFAIFQRPPGPMVDAKGEVAAARVKCLSDLFEAISAGVGPQSSNMDDPRTNVILLGEVHDDVVAHQMQLLILRRCLEVCKAADRSLVLSLEMFENDVQQVLDEYVLSRGIREQDFLQDARPWGNYARDYRPLVEFCREHGVRVVAANPPRRYVSVTARGGSRALKELMQQAPGNSPLPPLPLPPASAAYHANFVEVIASEVPQPATNSAGECPYIGFKASDVRSVRPEMMEAQLLWDHTMAQSIARSLQSTSPADRSPLVLHVCGAFHCAHGLGIPEVLPQYLAAGSPLSQPPTVHHQEPVTWLPIDEALGQPKVHSVSGVDSSSDDCGPKQSPPGVISVICWPASVAGAVSAVRSGQQVQSLAIMGDWVVITDESAGERTSRREEAAAPHRLPVPAVSQ